MDRGWRSTYIRLMPEYQYRCPQCRHMFITLDRENIPPCPLCGRVSRRVWSFHTRNSMPEHFNTSVGGYVSNERELRDAFKEMSDTQSERVGTDHRYEYLTRAEMADPKAHGVTDEGLDATEKAHYVPD